MLDFSCESSALQRIHLKYQALFSLKNNEKIFMNVTAAVVTGALRFKLFISARLKDKTFCHGSVILLI